MERTMAVISLGSAASVVAFLRAPRGFGVRGGGAMVTSPEPGTRQGSRTVGNYASARTNTRRRRTRTGPDSRIV